MTLEPCGHSADGYCLGCAQRLQGALSVVLRQRNDLLAAAQKALRRLDDIREPADFETAGVMDDLETAVALCEETP